MLRLPISTLAFQVHRIGTSTSFGGSQKYFFCICPDPLWSAPAFSLVAKHQLFGTSGFACSRKNFMVWGCWLMVYAWAAGKEEKTTVGPTWHIPCLLHEAASLCSLLFVGSSPHIQAEHTSLWWKRWFCHTWRLYVFLSPKPFCLGDALELTHSFVPGIGCFSLG